MTIRRFEDIEAWQSARRLASSVYKACQSSGLSKDFGLKDQLQRSAVSVMANIAEGFERKSPKEFAHYLRIARGSCAEVQSHLYIALDAGLLKESTFSQLQGLAIETGSKISGFQRYLKNQENQSE